MLIPERASLNSSSASLMALQTTIIESNAGQNNDPTHSYGVSYPVERQVHGYEYDVPKRIPAEADGGSENDVAFI